VAATSRKCCEDTFEGAAGVVLVKKNIDPLKEPPRFLMFRPIGLTLRPAPNKVPSAHFS